MTSSPSWFSGIARASSAAVVAAGPGAGAGVGAGGKRRQVQGALFKYGPKSAQVLSLSLGRARVRLAAGDLWGIVLGLLGMMDSRVYYFAL
jgi:hypothetical protein